MPAAGATVFAARTRGPVQLKECFVGRYSIITAIQTTFSPYPDPHTLHPVLRCHATAGILPPSTPLSNQGFTWLIIMTHTNWNSYLATHQQKIEHRIGYYSCFVGSPDTHLFICLPSLLRHPLNNIRHVFIRGLVLFCITLFIYVSARQLGNVCLWFHTL